VNLDKFWRRKKILFAFKGYTCRFKSEAFASFASIALRPWWQCYSSGYMWGLYFTNM